MKIKGIKEIYLRAPGQCKISQDEARLTHSWCENGDTSSYKPTDIKELGSDMRSILSAYAKGNIVFIRDNLYPKNGKSTNVEKLMESTQTQEAKVIYSEESDTPKLPNTGNKGISQISEMDFEALKTENPIGSIDPPMPGVKFKLRLKTPAPNGFINDLGYGNYEMSSLQGLQVLTGDKRFRITHPNLTSSNVPVPMAGRITSVGENATKIAIPTESDPLIWRVPKRGKELSYTLDQVAEGHPFLKADPKAFKVSEEEQKYWRAVLPLPDLVKQKLEAAQKEGSVDEIVHLITSFIGYKDKETKLSNFRYICHPRVGIMFRGFAKEGLLPLLMNELRVGHCDLLAWYVASQLRAYGATAWVSEDVLPTKDGKHFNGSYNHATVVIEKPDCTLVNYDPTIHCDIDNAYHPKIMTGDLIDTLEDKLLEANTINEKAEVLRSFNREVLPPLRKKANESHEVMSEWRSIIEAGIFGSLLIEPSEFKNGFTEMRGVVVSWDRLPENASLEAMFDLIIELQNTKDYPCVGPLEPYISSRELRRKLSWFYQVANKIRSPVCYMDLRGTSIKEFDPNADLNSEDLLVWQEVLECNNQTQFIPGIMCERTSVNDVLESYTALSKSSQDEFKYDGSIGTINLALLKGYKEKKFASYGYTLMFKRMLKNGRFPNYLSQSRICEVVNFKNGDGKGKALDFNKFCKLRFDLVNFAFEYQLACQDPEYRKHLLSKLDISEEDSRNLSLGFLGYNRKLQRAELPFVPRRRAELEKNFASINQMVYLDNKGRALFESSVRNVLVNMDKSPARGKIIILDERRQYHPGDDMRNIDWNAFARFEKLYVKSSPVLIQDVSTPLHVAFELYFEKGLGDLTGIYSLQARELVRILQEEVKAKKREIFVSFNGGNYYRLPYNVKSEDFFISAFSQSDKKTSTSFPKFLNV